MRTEYNVSTGETITLPDAPIVARDPAEVKAESIAELETSITSRNLRGAALGDAFSIAKIQSVEDEINALR